jgi:hypothetical protein
VLPLFWANTLFWDGDRWFTAPDNNGHNIVSSSVSLRVTRMSHNRDRKRLTHRLSLYFFAATWLIFEGTVRLLPTVYHGQKPTHPFSEVKNRMVDTYQRVESLDAICHQEYSCSTKIYRRDKCGQKFGQTPNWKKQRLMVKSFLCCSKLTIL